MKSLQRKIIFIIFIIAIILLGTGKVEAKAAYFSTDINGIDESKYPGYKQKIQELQKIYPNIQLLYTGLDWNTVIKNEYGVEGRNLVEKTQPKEWRDGDKLYDTGWYRASKEAVEYVMDPRNSLDTTNIFQFQKLNTTVGTNKDEIRKVLQMQKVLYLQNDEDSIVAFTNVAQKNKINAYHLITRVIQEQGRSGTSPLCSGAKYVGTDGVTYEGYYNLFNIGATGNGRDNVITNGLARAKKENWTSRAASINGGGNFVGNDYIDVGQNTLYLQKFAVYNTNGSLYWHQYMTNLLAAKSEASILLKNYQITGAQNNKDFVFIVPIYENMPKQACPEPSGEYRGNINTQLIDFNYITGANGDSYLTGNVDVAEWVNGICKTPREIPSITLKSTDGKINKNMYVAYKNNIQYYFDINIETIDTTKEYYIEVKLTGDKNLATDADKTQILKLPNKILKENFKNTTIKIKDNKIMFSIGKYYGEINTNLLSVELIQNSKGENYISGYVEIAEWIKNGNGATTPRTVPEIRIKSTDGTINMVTYISYQDGLKYYFDKIIEYLDVSKEYYLEAKLITEENIATEAQKTQKIRLGNKTIGKFKDITVNAKNDNFVLNYIGTVNTETLNLSLVQNAKGENYISGNINVAEWINGECKTPYELPIVRIKSTDGKVSTNAYVNYQNGLKYYFDKNITDFDTRKEYYIEVELTSKNNIATLSQKTQHIKIPNSTIGVAGTVTVIGKDNKIKISDSSLYVGNINTELTAMNIIQNSAGDDYISGYINIAEWVKGECRTPSEVPSLKLKSIDGKVEEEMFVNYQAGIKYYFDKNIKNIDTTKEYYIEAKLVSKKNIGEEENKKQIANIKPQGIIGICKNGNKVKVTGNSIKIEGNKYKGTINTELTTMNIIQNAVGDDYISGYINIAEWVDGKCKTPSEVPSMKLKSTDGKVETEMFVSYQEGIRYYFDKNIKGLDDTKEYYIEVKLKGKNNIATEKEKTQQANIKPQGEIGICTNGNIVKTSENKIQIIKAKKENTILEEQEEKKEIKEELKIEEEKVQKEEQQEETEKCKEEKTEEIEKEEQNNINDSIENNFNNINNSNTTNNINKNNNNTINNIDLFNTKNNIK